MPVSDVIEYSSSIWVLRSREVHGPDKVPFSFHIP